MNLIGTALAGIYVVAVTRSASATPGNSGDSAGTGKADITCEPGKPTNFTVSQPNSTVTVTCPGSSGVAGASETAGYTVYLDADCSKLGVPSSVCPGAIVSVKQQDGEDTSRVNDQVSKKGPIVTLRFPQLPASQQVVCVKCPVTAKSKDDCKAVITVAAAPPQGPQACAVGGTSIMLEINKAGDSAQFACGEGRTVAPTDPTEAYAEDCSKVETLKDMTRSDAPSEAGYLTVKVDKLKRKKLCYLCQLGK